jgi:hypothetical protein
MSGVTAEEDKKPADGGVHINLKVKGQVWPTTILIFTPIALRTLLSFLAEILVHLLVVLWYHLGI